MCDFENKLIINKDDMSKTVTVQLTGDASFIEQTIPTIMDEFGFKSEENNSIQSYSDKKGYISKEVKRDQTAPSVHRNNYHKQSSQDDVPEYYKTGIIKRDNGEDLYKCRYICPNCKAAHNRYVPRGTDKVDCHNCDYTMQIKPVSSDPEVRDSFQNFYTAGMAKANFNRND